MKMACVRVSMAMATIAALAACGGSGGYDSSSPTAPTGGGGGAATATITITRQAGAQSFSPNPASVGGQLVAFRNADTVVHRVVLNDGSIDTGDSAPGATSRTVMMPATGTNYHCSLHTDMVGAVSPSSGGPPPACTGLYCDD